MRYYFKISFALTFLDFDADEGLKPSESDFFTRFNESKRAPIAYGDPFAPIKHEPPPKIILKDEDLLKEVGFV